MLAFLLGGVFFGPFVDRMCAFYPSKVGSAGHFCFGVFCGPLVDRMCTFYL